MRESGVPPRVAFLVVVVLTVWMAAVWCPALALANVLEKPHNELDDLNAILRRNLITTSPTPLPTALPTGPPLSVDSSYKVLVWGCGAVDAVDNNGDGLVSDTSTGVCTSTNSF